MSSYIQVDILYTEGEGENHLETEGAEIRAPVPGCFSSEECRSKFGESFGTGHNAGESLGSWFVDQNSKSTLLLILISIFTYIQFTYIYTYLYLLTQFLGKNPGEPGAKKNSKKEKAKNWLIKSIEKSIQGMERILKSFREMIKLKIFKKWLNCWKLCKIVSGK